MSQLTILDDVFVGVQKHSRKLSMRQIFGLSDKKQSSHQRFHSNEFIPFITERNIKGQLIKDQPQSFRNKKQSQFSKFGLQIGTDFKQNLVKANKKHTLIDARFKFHEVNHFREVASKSHLRKLPAFRKELQSLNNKDFERKHTNDKPGEDFQVINFHTTLQSDKTEAINKGEILNKKKQHQSLRNLNKIETHDQLHQKRSKKLDLHQHGSKSYKSLLNTKSDRNQELKQIERQVKVHFNHPELERLRQSRRLTFKFIENLEDGDKEFKSKVELYRLIKERIKKQMTKL